MRRTLAITLLLTVLLLVSGGLDGSAAAATPVPAHGVRPPTWVEREVLWQSLSAGVAQPSLCRWQLTSPARAARLAAATRFLRSFPGLGRVSRVKVVGDSVPQIGVDRRGAWRAADATRATHVV